MAMLAGFRGIDTRHSPGAAMFQPGDNGMFLVEAGGCFVTDDAKLKALPGAQAAATGTEFKSGISTAFGLLVQDGGTLVRSPGPDQEVLVSGLNASAVVAFDEHQGQVFWTDGTSRGRITDAGVPLPWGLPQAQTPSLTLTTGTAAAGRYLVSHVWVDAAGAVSGCAKPAEISLAAPGAFIMADPAFPDDATLARVYVSHVDGPVPWWCGDYAEDEFPLTLDASIIPSKTDPAIPLRTQGLHPLPAGSGISTRGGFIMTWTGNMLRFSAGNWTHLYNPQFHYYHMPSPILHAIGLEGGIWVTTERGLYFIQGPDPTKSSVLIREGAQNSARQYAAGGTAFPAAFCGIDVPGMVAVFVSSDGPVYCMPTGQLVAPMAASQKWDVEGKTASFAVFEHAGHKLIAIGGIG